MSEMDLPKIKMTLALLSGAYLILFMASLGMLVMHTRVAFFALTLGSAVVLRIMVYQPLKARYNEALRKKERDEHQEQMLGKMKEALEKDH